MLQLNVTTRLATRPATTKTKKVGLRESRRKSRSSRARRVAKRSLQSFVGLELKIATNDVVAKKAVGHGELLGITSCTICVDEI